jgi:hypothetical protein
MPKKFAFTLALVSMVVIIAAPSFAQHPEPKKTEIRGHTMYTLMEPGGIPAIFEPEFVSIEVADSFYYDDEPLIAVSSGDVARGYSTWHLDHHEIVNDVLEGTAIAVTW